MLPSKNHQKELGRSENGSENKPMELNFHRTSHLKLNIIIIRVFLILSKLNELIKIQIRGDKDIRAKRTLFEFGNLQR